MTKFFWASPSNWAINDELTFQNPRCHITLEAQISDICQTILHAK